MLVDTTDDGNLPALDAPVFKFPSAEGYVVPEDWKPTVDRPLPALRCYYIRPDGSQCKKFGLRGTGLNGSKSVCEFHGGQLPAVKAYAEALVVSARMRLVNSADLAVDTLLDLLKPGTQANVRLKASTEVLDRIGVKGGYEIKVEVEQTVNQSEIINDRLAQIASRMKPKPEEPEDLGEIVDEPAGD